MPDTASLVIIKESTYRDQPEEWSNKYHFEGTVPADATAWDTLVTGWVNEERKLYGPGTKVVRAYGYEPGSNHANFVKDYEAAPNTPVAGSFVPGAGNAAAPGDAAATVRWDTGEYNARGKKIYCRKYFHGVHMDGGQNDHVDPLQLTAYTSFAAVVTSGFLPGSAKYCGPQGANLGAHQADQYITTRTLKRRGKRPLVSA